MYSDDQYDYIMSEAHGSEWERYICPIKGAVGNDLCYVDRSSEECKNARRNS